MSARGHFVSACVMDEAGQVSGMGRQREHGEGLQGYTVLDTVPHDQHLAAYTQKTRSDTFSKSFPFCL